MSEKWDRRFMELAWHIAAWSKDRSRGVGCVIVGPQHCEIRATGYNGFPRGANDHDDALHERPAKYAWTEHAERNAIYNAARVGVEVSGCTMYCTLFPCEDCARAIIQVGVTRLVVPPPDFNDPTYGERFKTSVRILSCGLEVEDIDLKPDDLPP